MPRSVPNYLTTDANGNVGADFTGRITAQGLDLLASTNTVLPDDRTVRFERESDGTAIAHIGAYEGSGAAADSDMLALRGNGGLDIRGGSASDYARLQIYQDPASAIAALVASTVSHSRLILSQTGASDFLRLGTAGNKRILAAHMAADGTVLEGDGITCSHLGTGQYTVFFSTAFAARPVVTLTAYRGTSGIGIASIDDLQNYNTVQVGVRTINNDTFADLSFTVQVIGRM